ncbi:PLDc N-terminal domain-containing protein [Georgenia ruanii]|uniref:PLDc N-terminal domain-containing protein n=1 Tax=Georgenia ruanii TaxID=348442 RepID=UPI001D021B25|nr:PLDc N-terminal domain-containing protein [Georgenia ruanii]
MDRTRISWAQLSTGQRAALVALGAVEVALAAAAWTDLARRPAEAVNGRKSLWAAAIAVNIVGPLSYFKWGRRAAE